MNILYLSYWGIDEGLTQSAILPHIEILEKYEEVEKIILVSIERKQNKIDFKSFSKKLEHYTLFTKGFSINHINKISDFIDFPKQIKYLLKNNSVNYALSHGSPGGALLAKSCPKDVPFSVFFEPHSQYMLESGVWNKYDPRYIFMKKWEHKIIKKAQYLFCVTDNYKQILVNKGIEKSKLMFVPNFCDENKFSFTMLSRKEFRNKLGIHQNTTNGIYVGKFGGIYLNDKAFEIFDFAKKQFQNFFLTILTPDDKVFISTSLLKLGFKKNEFFIDCVSHNEVPNYLNASDFAFSLQQPKNSNQFLSPLKNGEYMMNGLPIFMVNGVGDEMHYIEKEKIGVTFEINNQSIIDKLSKIETIININVKEIEDSRKKIKNKGEKYRSIDFTIEAFDKILKHKN